MVKANELRIGNLLMDKLTGSYLRVTELDEAGNIGTYVIDRSKFPLPEGWQLKPIPLTAEILLQAGFEKRTHTYIRFMQINSPLMLVISENLEIMSIKDHISSLRILEVEYKKLPVHELQNIFFLLTGDELEIKL